MSVIYSGECAQFQLNTKSFTYLMQVRNDYLLHLYWGEKLDERDHSYMFWEQGRAAFSPRQENCEGFILDDIPLEYPCWGRGDMRTPAIEIINPDGSNIIDLHYESHDVISGKPELKGLPAVYAEKSDEAETLIITLKDSVSKITVKLYYTLFEALDILCRHAEIINDSDKSVFINRAMSASVDFDRKDFDIISNYGTHCRERNIERSPLKYGRFNMSSRRGASSHVHNPFLIMTSPSANETSGDTYGFVLVYSGSFTAEVAANQFSSARTIIGLNSEEFGWKLHSGESFTTPEAVLSYSPCGLESLSANYHGIFRTRLCRGKYRDTRRPVLLNSWEACYFSFDEERLKKIGTCCKDIGIELLVIDDGWFGVRDTDNCSLGDWVVDRRKLPNGIEGIYNHLKPLGIDLGIWFEPEMVSPNSDLYRAHPDWCIHIPNRPRSQGRHQFMLNLSKPEVCDYIYESVAAILKSGMIKYVKWDYNRNMTEIANEKLPADQQREVTHRYYLGLYSLLERLVTTFPDILFESCSGGGGRFDAGMLYYMPQVWTSDNSDAIERLKIQYGTSLVYPLSSMSAHVSASPNHQTGHVTPFDTRFTVALTGSFGYELDPTSLSDEDKASVLRTAGIYKEYGERICNGTYHRLRNPHEENCSAWCIVSENKDTCIAGYVLTKVRMYENNERIRLRGLKKDWIYIERFSGREYSGAELCGYGIPAPLTLEYQSLLWIFERKE
ncbi:MAG: alpha-galactosidase [Eubacteriales bacterium]|nr:alpha-galactosidase [Eubacteriales bacterium]MDD4421832.1 alpha-galactosidase [Eubacteriales bacterium]